MGIQAHRPGGWVRLKMPKEAAAACRRTCDHRSQCRMRRTELAAVVLLACACLQRSLAIELTGKVHSPATASTIINLYLSTGEKLVTYPHNDGTFKFTDVPKGIHLLQPYHPTVYFPEVQVDVGKTGLYRAQLLAQTNQGGATQPALLPLALRPVGEMTYYEKRKPVDVWSLVKSPYGLMIVFSLFIIVVMPRLKVDPEEMSRLQDELKGIQNGPGGSNTAAAGGGGAGQQAPARIAGGAGGRS